MTIKYLSTDETCIQELANINKCHPGLQLYLFHSKCLPINGVNDPVYETWIAIIIIKLHAGAWNAIGHRLHG